MISEGRLYDTAQLDHLQPVNPWSKTGITPKKSAPDGDIDMDSETETPNENTDMRTAMEYNDPIIAMGLEYYGGSESDSDDEHIFSQEVSEDEGEEANDVTMEATFHSALDSNESNDNWVTAASSFGNSVNETEAVASTNLSHSNQSTSTPFGPTTTSTPVEKGASSSSTRSKRPQSPLLSAVAKKPALSTDASGVMTRNFQARRAIFKPPFLEAASSQKGPNDAVNDAVTATRNFQARRQIFKPPFREAASSQESDAVNEAVEATRQRLIRAEISANHSPQITIEERTSRWPSWLKMHNPKNSCWCNSTTNGLFWTLKSQNIASIGRPPLNSPPGQWRPLDFFKNFYNLEVGAHADPTLLLQKLASRKKMPQLKTEQFPAELLLELKEFTECFYQRLCPILQIQRSAGQCSNPVCLQQSDPQESLSKEHMLPLTFLVGATSHSLQEMVLRFCNATFQSDCKFCGQVDTVTRTTKTLIKEPRDGIIFCVKRVKYVNEQRVSNHSFIHSFN